VVKHVSDPNPVDSDRQTKGTVLRLSWVFSTFNTISAISFPVRVKLLRFRKNLLNPPVGRNRLASEDCTKKKINAWIDKERRQHDGRKHQ
jgi:hypothetical protein